MEKKHSWSAVPIWWLRSLFDIYTVVFIFFLCSVHCFMKTRNLSRQSLNWSVFFKVRFLSLSSALFVPLGGSGWVQEAWLQMVMTVTCSGIRRPGCFRHWSCCTRIWREPVLLTGLKDSRPPKTRQKNTVSRVSANLSTLNRYCFVLFAHKIIFPKTAGD